MMLMTAVKTMNEWKPSLSTEMAADAAQLTATMAKKISTRRRIN